MQLLKTLLEIGTGMGFCTDTLIRLLQPLNAESPMHVTLPEMITEVRPLQPENVLSLIIVTLLGIDTEVKLLQHLNADSPIYVTLSGIATEVKLLQPLKAQFPRLFTKFERVTDVRLLQSANALSLILVTPVKYFNSSNEVIAVLRLNTVPKLVTAAASVSLSSPLPFVSQLAKQSALTLVSAKLMAGEESPISIISLNSFQTSADSYSVLQPTGTKRNVC